MPLIAIEDLGYRYPTASADVFANLSATVEAGAVILLRGPSGSGKSTLLRCLNGLVPHSTGGRFSGRVVVCGLDTRHHPPRELGSHVGFVFQHPDAQFVLEDVESELAFGLENLGLPPPLMRKRIEEVLDQVGIHQLRGRRIASLSGGERQRVAIAAALVMHPSGLILPAGSDRGVRLGHRGLRALGRNTGRTAASSRGHAPCMAQHRRHDVLAA